MTSLNSILLFFHIKQCYAQPTVLLLYHSSTNILGSRSILHTYTYARAQTRERYITHIQVPDDGGRDSIQNVENLFHIDTANHLRRFHYATTSIKT
jgi:hypothetical protein